MLNQLNDLVHWSRYFPAAVCVLALQLVSFESAFGATKSDGTVEITDGKEQFMSTLASMPYTKSGAGPILYVVECSAFLPTQAFERDWKGQLDGVEVRRIFVAVNPTTANEAGYLARTRNLDDFYAFMNRTKVAPTITSQDKAGVAAAQSMIRPYGKVLKPLMIKNGWQQDSPIPPQFMWEINGHAYVARYSKNSFAEILSMLRSGTPTAQASATPSRASAQAPASNANDTSAAETTAQLMTAEKNSPKPEGNAAVATSGSAPAASGGTGPDIMGLRIGMTGDEARAIFKSRILVSDDLRQAYRESSATLGFIDGGSLVSVPNGKYLQDMAVRRNPTNSWWSVGFEPVPGHERIQSIMWQIAYPRDNYPTFDVFEKTLAEKYGPPTGDFRRPSAVDRARARGINSMFYWIYDSNGTLRIPGSGNVSECLPWRGINDSALVGPIETQTLEPDFSAKCGAIFFTVYMMLEDPLNPGPKTLVTGHETRMTGFDAALHGAKVAGAIIGKIQTDAKEAAIKKGQQQKPAF